MKCLLTSVLVIISILASTAQEEVSIITYNIRYDAPNDGPNNWHHRKVDMIDFFIDQDADFIGIQEALVGQLKYLDQGLTEYAYIGVGRDDGVEAGEFMALFYKPSVWSLIQDSTLWLSEEPGIPSRGWDGACNRLVTIGTFANAAGDTIQLLNTHLDHVGEQARKGGIALLEQLYQSRNQAWPFYLLGDFNLEPNDPLYSDLTANMLDVMQGTQAGGTYNEFKVGVPTDRRIDYIFYDRGTSSPLSADILFPTTKAQLQLSDHYPVKAIFQLQSNQLIDITAEDFLPGKYLQGQYVQDATTTLNYQILYPKDFDADQKYPLVLFLHGMGERGTDNESQMTHGSRLFRDSIDNYPAVVIFPQCPPTDYWANLSRPDEGGASRKFTFHTDQPPHPSMGAVISLIDEMLGADYIDEQRFYVSGLSMGAMGVWELLWRMPEKIAAAIPICGGGPTIMADKMNDVPIWAFHGTKDGTVNVNMSIQMVGAIQRSGGTAKITLLPDVGHNAWDPAFADPKFLSWLFSKVKK